MAQDKQEERSSNLIDMNGNKLHEGDLVMVILDKPCVAGYIVKIEEPSVLVPTKQQKPGILRVHGIVNIAFQPGRPKLIGHIAKLVHPMSEAIVDAVAKDVEVRRDEVGPPNPTQNVKPNGPTSVTPTEPAQSHVEDVET